MLTSRSPDPTEQQVSWRPNADPSYAQPQRERSSVVDEQLNALMNEISALEGGLHSLVERLEPVLTPELPATVGAQGGGGGAAIPSGKSIVAARIAHARMQVQTLQSLIGIYAARLEI